MRHNQKDPAAPIPLILIGCPGCGKTYEVVLKPNDLDGEGRVTKAALKAVRTCPECGHVYKHEDRGEAGDGEEDK